MSLLGANTDLLRSERFSPAWQHMSWVTNNFAQATTRNLPPGTIRCQTDVRLQEGLQNGIDLVKAIMEGITMLAHGDTRNVDALRKILSQVEETNNRLSGSWDGGHTRH